MISRFYAVEFSINDADRFDQREIDDSRDLREVIVEAESKKRKMEVAKLEVSSNSNDELVATQQRLKKVTEEMEKLREEMIILQSRGGVRYALGFDPGEFIKMKFTESLQWVTSTLTPRMKDEMAKFPEYFRIVQLIGDISDVGNKTCAGYNRGSPCRTKWHTYNRPTGAYSGVEELRLHCCVLCMEALGIVSGHPLVECPWINQATWSIIHS